MSVSAGRYDPDRSFEPSSEPGFTFEIEVISGEEGRELRLEQARAIREFLLWLRCERASADSGADETIGGETADESIE